MVNNLIVLLKVEFLPKFSVRGVWQRWRESYPTDGSKADDAITVFTGVRIVCIRIVHVYDMVHFHGTLVCVYNLSMTENNYVYYCNYTKTAFINYRSSHSTLVCVYNLSLNENDYVYCYYHAKKAFINYRPYGDFLYYALRHKNVLSCIVYLFKTHLYTICYD